MSDSSTQLLVSLEARIDKFEKAMNKAGETADKKFGEIEKRTKEAGDRMTEQLGESVEGVNRILEAIGIGLGLKEISELADAYINLKTNITLAAGSAEKGAAVMEALSGVARRTATTIDDVSEQYLKNHQVLTDLGYSTQSQVDLQEALSDALILSGSNAEQTAALQNTLTRALAEGRLEGQGLARIFQNGSVVAKVLADSLGVTTSQLRLMGDEGKLTSNVIVSALVAALPKLREQAAQVPLLIGRSLTLLKNAFSEFIGKTAEATGAAQGVANVLAFVADHFDAVSRGALAAGAVILSAYVPGLARAALAQLAVVATNPFLLMATTVGAAVYAISEFGDKLHPVTGDLATLQDYGVATWDALRDGAEVAAQSVSAAFATVAQLIARALGGAEIPMHSLSETAIYVADVVINAFRLMASSVYTTLTKLPLGMAETIVDAVNSMIAAVESGINAVIRGTNAAIDAINRLGGKVGVTLSDIGAVNLGRVTNAFRGYGKEAADAYVAALQDASKDRVGDALKELRERADVHAEHREHDEQAEKQKSNLDSKDKPVAPPNSAFEKAIREQQQRTAVLQQETAARRTFAGSLEEEEAAADRAKTAQTLLNAAIENGVQPTDDTLKRISQLADAYSRASAEAKALDQTQKEAAETAKQLSDTSRDAFKGFVDDLAKGKTAAQALRDAVLKMAEKIESIAWDNLWKSVVGEGDQNPFFRSLGKALTPETKPIYAPGSSLPALKDYAKALNTGSMTVTAGTVNVNGQAVPTSPGAPGAAPVQSLAPTSGQPSPYGDLSAAQKAFGTMPEATVSKAVAEPIPPEKPLPASVTKMFPGDGIPATDWRVKAFGGVDGGKIQEGLKQGFSRLKGVLGFGKTPPAPEEPASGSKFTPYGDLNATKRDFAPTAAHMADGQTGRFPINWRNDNPGNLRASGWTQRQPGFVGERGGFAQFDTAASGYRAANANLDSYAARGIVTPNQILQRWAPTGDGNNDPAAYAARVQKLTGLDPNSPLGSDAASRAAMLKGITEVEGGRTSPFSTRQIQGFLTQGQGGTQGINQAVTQLQQSLTKGATGVTSGLSSLTGDLSQGATGISGALSSLTKSLSSGGGGFGGLFSGGGGDFASFADGGWIGGVGTGTSDSNLVAASKGEFIVNADAAGKYAPLLHAINEGKAPKIGGNLANLNLSHQSATDNSVTVNMHGNADKKTADLIADKVAKARSDQAKPMRYTQKQVMASAHGSMTRAAAHNS
jgi:tape measure domain-containing protein